MSIRQGEIYWIDFESAEGSKASGVYPGVIVQHDIPNKSDIKTVIVCLITSTLKRANAPGNVELYPGEGGLREHSVVNVSLITHVNKTDIMGQIGMLRPEQLEEILNGVQLMTKGP